MSCYHDISVDELYSQYKGHIYLDANQEPTFIHNEMKLWIVMASPLAAPDLTISVFQSDFSLPTSTAVFTRSWGLRLCNACEGCTLNFPSNLQVDV